MYIYLFKKIITGHLMIYVSNVKTYTDISLEDFKSFLYWMTYISFHI